MTDVYNRADHSRSRVYILDCWDPATHTFARIIPYLDGLRNLNNPAFYTDPAGQIWLYLPLTDRLLRYRYRARDVAPTSAPEVLARYPDYGLYTNTAAGTSRARLRSQLCMDTHVCS